MNFYDLVREGTDTDEPAQNQSDQWNLQLLFEGENIAEMREPGGGDLLEQLSRSQDMSARRAADVIRLLKESPDEEDKRQADQLVQMLSSPEKQPVAIAIVRQFEDKELRKTFLETLSKSDNALSAILESMLTGKAQRDSGPNGIHMLVCLLAGSEETKKTGEAYLKLLADPNEQKNAAFMLETFSSDYTSLSAALKLRRLSSAEELATVTSLLKSESVRERIAGVQLLHLLTSEQPNVCASGKNFLAMLGTNKLDVCEILSGLTGRPASFPAMYAILRNPEMKTAAAELRQLLRTPAGADGAADILELLGSEFQQDKAAGELALKALNSKSDTIRQTASRLVQSQISPESQFQLFKAMDNTEFCRGVLSVIELLDSASRERQESGARLLELFNGNVVEQKTAKELVELLGHDDEAKRAAGATILRTLTDSRSAQQLMGWMKSNEHAESANQLLAWLNGSAPERAAAKALIALESGAASRRRGRGSDAEAKPSSLTQTMLKMIETPSTRQTAMAMLSELEGPTRLQKFVSICQTPGNETCAAKLTELLLSPHASQRESVHRLLTMFEPKVKIDSAPLESIDSYAGYAALGAGLIDLLNDSTQTSKALKILSLPAAAGSSLFSMLETPEYKTTAGKILEMVGDPFQKNEASKLLSTLMPDELKVLMAIYENPQQRTAANKLRLELGTEATKRILRLAASASEEERAFGQQLLQDLNNRAEQDAAFELLQTRLPTKELAKLRELIRDKTTNAAAVELLKLEQSNNFASPNGVLALLSLLGSENQSEQKSAELLLRMLSTPNQRELAVTLVSFVSTTQSLLRLSKALQDPEERSSAEQLIQRLGREQATDDVSPRDPAKELALMLTSPELDRKTAAERLFKMMSNEKERDLAVKIMNTLPSNSYGEFLALVQPGENATQQQQAAADQVKAIMANSPASARTLMSLLSSDADSGKRLIQLLATPAQQALANAMLKRLNENQCSSLLKCMSAPENSPAVEIILRRLQSDSQAQLESVREFLNLLSAPARSNGSEAPNLEPHTWLKLLNKSETREVAEKALSLAGSASAARLLGTLVATSEGQKLIERLSKLPVSEGRIIVGFLTAEKVEAFAKIAEDPALRVAADKLLGMAASDGEGRFAAFILLNLLTDRREADRSFGKMLLAKLNTTDDAGEVERLLVNLPRDRGFLWTIYAKPELKHAAATITELVSSDLARERGDTEAVVSLIALLKKPNSDEGPRMVQMLNNPRTTARAIQLLKKMGPIFDIENDND
ncbi:MAG: hypothetical protein K2W95_34050 [Candidatus Obscuribacterales bacterium]|nr:hypothetical protein [Candidatus Obscuribacterales bacterium]